jgi:hypothetical protein
VKPCQAQKLKFARSSSVLHISKLCSLYHADLNAYHHDVVIESEFFTILGSVFVVSGSLSGEKKSDLRREKK